MQRSRKTKVEKKNYWEGKQRRVEGDKMKREKSKGKGREQQREREKGEKKEC